MKKYRKKPIVIEAEQWFKVEYDKEVTAEYEAPVYHLNVGYYRHPDVYSESKCKHCDKIMHNHGWIATLGGGHTVCPGDWIIKETDGGFYPCKPNIFEKTYELILERKCSDCRCSNCKWCVETRYSFILQMENSIYTTIRNPAECHYHAANNYEYIDGERDVICNPFPLIDKYNYMCSHFSLKPDI